MASITTQFNQGSDVDTSFVFADNPIVIEVSFSFNQDTTFRQVIVDVSSIFGTTSRTHQFVISVAEGQGSVALDISSAVRSIMALYEYTTENAESGGMITYPYATFSVTAKERYMEKDGIVKESNPSSPERGTAYFGGLSDYERWVSGEHVYPKATTVKFTTKPSGEVLVEGHLSSASVFDTKTDTVNTTFIENASGISSDNRHSFLFVNSRGVLETVSVLARDAKEYEVSSEVMSLGHTPSYIPKPGMTTHKSLGPATWRMSSGYVNRAWAEWFATEFLTAKHYWMRVDGRWLPVVVSPSENAATIYDRNDPSLRDVQFIVRAAVNGRVG